MLRQFPVFGCFFLDFSAIKMDIEVGVCFVYVQICGLCQNRISTMEMLELCGPEEDVYYWLVPFFFFKS